MAVSAADEHVLAETPWRYRIVRRGDRFLYDLHVESGFASWDEEHPLTRDEAEALLAAPRRAMLLFAALHPIHQSRSTPEPGLTGRIALAPRDEAEASLDELDRHHNGACSNLLRILLGRPERSPRMGWFEGEGAP